MKFAYIGNFTQVRSTEEYVALGLEANGHEVVRIEENEHDYASALNALPTDSFVLLFSKLQLRDMPFKQQCKDVEPTISFLRAVGESSGCRGVVAWLFDLMRPEFNVGRWRWANAVAKVCDKFLCTDSGLNVPNVGCLRQGYPGPLHGMGRKKSELECRVGFLGELYGMRKYWWNMLKRDLDVKRFTDVFCDDLLDCCASCDVLVGPPYPSYPGYWSNRIYLVTGYGGLFATNTVEGMLSEGWEPNVNYVALPTDVGAASAKLKWWLRDENAALRAEIRVRGTVHARKLTYARRAQDLAEICSKIERRVRS